VRVGGYGLVVGLSLAILKSTKSFRERLRQVTRNQQACIRNAIEVEEAKEAYLNHSKWKEVISAYPKGKRA
jgi:hypothetical protein